MDIRDENGNAIDTRRFEYAEQGLARTYIRKGDKVLELGARYGSVSCIINAALGNKTNQVVVEPDERVWAALERNRSANNCSFHIVKGFVSNKRLGLHLGGYGTTAVENTESSIPSFTLDAIKQRYGVDFNVLVADCEGFLETFFAENPNFADGLRLIIFEADYSDKCNYAKIRSELARKGFIQIIGGFQNVWSKTPLPLFGTIVRKSRIIRKLQP